MAVPRNSHTPIVFFCYGHLNIKLTQIPTIINYRSLNIVRVGRWLYDALKEAANTVSKSYPFNFIALFIPVTHLG